MSQTARAGERNEAVPGACREGGGRPRPASARRAQSEKNRRAPGRRKTRRRPRSRSEARRAHRARRDAAERRARREEEVGIRRVALSPFGIVLAVVALVAVFVGVAFVTGFLTPPVAPLRQARLCRPTWWRGPKLPPSHSTIRKGGWQTTVPAQSGTSTPRRGSSSAGRPTQAGDRSRCLVDREGSGWLTSPAIKSRRSRLRRAG